MGKQITKEVADRTLSISKAIAVEITRFKAAPRRWPNYDFVGFISLALVGQGAAAGFKLFLPNIQVKVLKGGLYLAMPSEKGGNGNFYTDFCTGSHETRLLLTHAVRQNADVKAALQALAAMPKPAGDASAQDDSTEVEAEVEVQEENPYLAQ